MAIRLSVRDFAARLGMNDKPVSSWESRGRRALPRHETQQLLDLLLKDADDDVKARFELLLRQGTGDLGGKSAERTKTLLAAMQPHEPTMPYVPDAQALQRFQQFLESTSRVFVITGPPGCGKTQFTHYLAGLADGHDYQLRNGLKRREWHCKQALHYASATSDVGSRAAALISLASTHFYEGDPARAAAIFEQALTFESALHSATALSDPCRTISRLRAARARAGRSFID